MILACAHLSMTCWKLGSRKRCQEELLLNGTVRNRYIREVLKMSEMSPQTKHAAYRGRIYRLCRCQRISLSNCLKRVFSLDRLDGKVKRAAKSAACEWASRFSISCLAIIFFPYNEQYIFISAFWENWMFSKSMRESCGGCFSV